MGIPITVFPASQLPHRLQNDVHTGHRRKHPITDLQKCTLLEMLQWDCRVEGEKIRCWPIERLFRRCKDGATGRDITIEVTGVEKSREL